MRLTLAVSNDYGSLPDLETTMTIEEGAITIGRAADNDWVLPDPDRIVSNRHCTIQYRDGEYLIIDTSTNGVFINHAEERIERGQSVKLHDGDHLTLGTYEIVVEIDADADYETGNRTAVGLVTDILPISDQIVDPADLVASRGSWDDLPRTAPAFDIHAEDSASSPQPNLDASAAELQFEARPEEEFGMTEMDLPIKRGETDAVDAEIPAAAEDELSLWEKQNEEQDPEALDELQNQGTAMHGGDQAGDLEDHVDFGKGATSDAYREEDAAAMDAEPPHVEQQLAASEQAKPLEEREEAFEGPVIPEDWWIEEGSQEVESTPAPPAPSPTQREQRLDVSIVPYLRQQQHYLESFINDRYRYLRAYGWGIDALVLDEAALQRGEVAIVFARGVLPDGTPFDIPGKDALPEPLPIEADMQNTCIGLVAHKQVQIQSVADSVATLETYADVTDDVLASVVDRPRLQLMVNVATSDEQTAITIARIREVLADRRVVVDETYLPPTLNCHGVPALKAYMDEIQNLLEQRGEAFAGELGVEPIDSTHVLQLLALSIINRYQACFSHWLSTAFVHPADFYQTLLQMRAEMATFSSASSRRSRAVSAYDHADLAKTFAPVLAELRQCLQVKQPRPVLLRLKARGYGISLAPLGNQERRLLESRRFILAVEAATSNDAHALESDFPKRITIGPVEKIAHLVNQQRRGIELHTLATAPYEFEQGEQDNIIYFQLDGDSELWPQLLTSKGLALRVAEEFSNMNIKLQLWAIAA